MVFEKLFKGLKANSFMDKLQFENNLLKIYEISKKYSDETNSYLNIKEKGDKKDAIDSFLKENNLPINNESRFAVAMRIAFLKDTPIIQFLKKQNLNEEKFEEIKWKAYDLVREISERNFEKMLSDIKEKNLLNNFYLEILKGIHNIGKIMNRLQISWEKKINFINSDLEKKLGDKKSIMNFLRENNFLDKDKKGNEVGVCYSLLVNEGSYKIKSYYEVFEEIKEIINGLKKFKKNLEKYDDEVYNLKNEYLDYLDSLIDAFSETNRNKLSLKWEEVDRKWMKIKSPFQIGHFFECYDDPYRKSVSIEWDLRFQKLDFPENNDIEKIKEGYKKLFNKFGIEKYKEVYDKSLYHLNQVQLYFSKPLLYYGSHLNGLWIAQVLPNSSQISDELGKKIFGFPDMLLEQQRAKPFTKLSSEMFEKEFLDKARRFLFNETDEWYEVYDLSTIYHEFGHILWLGKNTESLMNKSGEFKNIEEFKATTFGIVMFMLNEKEEIKEAFLRDAISRAVGLISWKNEESFKPYYIEGLIHLTGLFDSGILEFNGRKILVDLSNDKYEKLKEWYIKNYESLAKHYLEKKDASEYLNMFVYPEKKTYLPKDEKLKEFVEYFYKKFQELGNIIDESVSKEDYIIKS